MVFTAKLDENRRPAGMLNPVRDEIDENEDTYRGERRGDTCDHGLSRRWKAKATLEKKAVSLCRAIHEAS